MRTIGQSTAIVCRNTPGARFLLLGLRNLDQSPVVTQQISGFLQVPSSRLQRYRVERATSKIGLNVDSYEVLDSHSYRYLMVALLERRTSERGPKLPAAYLLDSDSASVFRWLCHALDWLSWPCPHQLQPVRT